RAGRPDPLAERARAFAYWTLLARAQAASRALGRTRPAALVIDRIVTDLRWAAALKAELVRAEQLLLLRTVEVQVGAGLLDLPAAGAVVLLRRCLGTLSAAVDRFDPTAGRLAGVASMELSRAVTRWQGEQPGPRAARARVPIPETLDDWTRSVALWQAWTNPPAGLRQRLGALLAEDARLLTLRYGWDGGPPRDAVELGAATKRPARIVVRVLNAAERRALRPALRRGRANGGPP
ncbi:MAG: hypothetical protein K2Q09_04695, partial [Phycisphaerales bacterium]|nr:hypothetical protein [Phycisphaerales bacterium]